MGDWIGVTLSQPLFRDFSKRDGITLPDFSRWAGARLDWCDSTPCHYSEISLKGTVSRYLTFSGGLIGDWIGVTLSLATIQRFLLKGRYHVT